LLIRRRERFLSTPCCDNLRVLLSEAINQLLSHKRRDLRITEQMLILSCDRCGQSFTADGASISGQPVNVVYACPYDGASLVSVGAGKSSRRQGDIGFHAGALAITVGADEIGWGDFWMRELRGGPPGSVWGTFGGEFYGPEEEPAG
jgi:hypothetical protein